MSDPVLGCRTCKVRLSHASAVYCSHVCRQQGEQFEEVAISIETPVASKLSTPTAETLGGPK